jgi:hypothetical protein
MDTMFKIYLSPKLSRDFFYFTIFTCIGSILDIINIVDLNEEIFEKEELFFVKPLFDPGINLLKYTDISHSGIFLNSKT